MSLPPTRFDTHISKIRENVSFNHRRFSVAAANIIRTHSSRNTTTMMISQQKRARLAWPFIDTLYGIGEAFHINFSRALNGSNSSNSSSGDDDDDDKSSVEDESVSVSAANPVEFRFEPKHGDDNGDSTRDQASRVLNVLNDPTPARRTDFGGLFNTSTTMKREWTSSVADRYVWLSEDERTLLLARPRSIKPRLTPEERTDNRRERAREFRDAWTTVDWTDDERRVVEAIRAEHDRMRGKVNRGDMAVMKMPDRESCVALKHKMAACDSFIVWCPQLGSGGRVWYRQLASGKAKFDDGRRTRPVAPVGRMTVFVWDCFDEPVPQLLSGAELHETRARYGARALVTYSTSVSTTVDKPAPTATAVSPPPPPTYPAINSFGWDDISEPNAIPVYVPVA